MTGRIKLISGMILKCKQNSSMGLFWSATRIHLWVDFYLWDDLNYSEKAPADGRGFSDSNLLAKLAYSAKQGEMLWSYDGIIPEKSST